MTSARNRQMRLNLPRPLNPRRRPNPPTTQDKSEKPRDDKQEVQKGELIEAPRPIYPEEARAKKIEGQVTVSIVIGEEGGVISARPTSGPELLHVASTSCFFDAPDVLQ